MQVLKMIAFSIAFAYVIPVVMIKIVFEKPTRRRAGNPVGVFYALDYR